VTGLESRINRLENQLSVDGDDGEPRRIIIRTGPDLMDNAIRMEFGQYWLDVPCERDEDTMEHLSPEQRALIRPGLLWPPSRLFTTGETMEFFRTSADGPMMIGRMRVPGA